jgi:hypothetical protein
VFLTPRRAALLGSAALIAFAAAPASTQQRSEPPIARYTMDAGTTSGMAAMAAGGGNPLALLRGGGGASHQLVLHLGSSHVATGAPEADHFMPAGAGLGKSVPLVTPQRVSVPSAPAPTERPEPQRQLPSGKLYLFWGCGEHAPAGQPVVIDFAKMARGEIPPGLFASGANIPQAWQVTEQNSKTFGEWPNGKDAKQVPASASLLGDHRIAGNYSPEIDFKLDHDFMPPIQLSTSTLASGAWAASWKSLPDATGYYAWALGAKDMGRGQPSEMVWWTSSTTQQFGGPMSDWLSPSAVATLVRAGTVMPPSQTNCTVPAEVHKMGGDNMMLQFFAYGPESNFAYPPRPKDEKVVWKPDWIARVRFRANTMVLLGMNMGGFNAPQEDVDEQDQAQDQPPPEDSKPKCPGGFKGIAMRAAGVCR